MRRLYWTTLTIAEWETMTADEWAAMRTAPPHAPWIVRSADAADGLLGRVGGDESVLPRAIFNV